MCCAFPLCYCLVVSTSAIDCLQRLVSEMTCYVSSVTLNHTHSLTQLGLGHKATHNHFLEVLVLALSGDLAQDGDSTF